VVATFVSAVPTVPLLLLLNLCKSTASRDGQRVRVLNRVSVDHVNGSEHRPIPQRTASGELAEDTMLRDGKAGAVGHRGNGAVEASTRRRLRARYSKAFASAVTPAVVTTRLEIVP
jgi:hypothetical protein